jgi:hypothetical protein
VVVVVVRRESIARAISSATARVLSAQCNTNVTTVSQHRTNSVT